MKEKIPPKELFASPEDVVRANQIVEEELGTSFEADYTLFPKSTGAMGDEGVLGHSVLISPRSVLDVMQAIRDHQTLDTAANRICNETRAACRVVIDLTPDQPNRST